MKRILLVLTLFATTSCTSLTPEGQARSIMDRLEFGPEEEGCFRLSGQIDLNPIPFMSSTVNLDLRKSKGENAPDC